MPAVLPHPNEATRLDALRRLQVLDTPPEAEFDDLTRLAATICGTPIALVSLIDAHRQWFKSRYGLAAAEIPRDVAFCAHTILQSDLFEVPDAIADARFAANPLVTADPNIRFYAGIPLVTPDGHPVGTLCAIDRVPRTLNAEQRDALRVLGRQVVAQLLLRTQGNRLSEETREHETFRVLFEQSSDAHLIFDERDGIIDCNNAAVVMLRLKSKEEVLALHPAVLSPEFQPCGRRSMEKCLDMDAAARRNGFHRFDWTHQRADGEGFPCEVTLTPVHLHGRSVLLVVWHDLTERVRAEEALRASEEQHKLVLEGAGLGAWDWHVASGRVDFNARWAAMLGYSVDEVEPHLRGWEKLVHPDDLPVAMAALNAHLSGRNSSYQAEVRLRHKDGHWVWVLDSGRVIEWDAAGQPVRACGTHLDITDRRRAEQALRTSAERRRQQQIALLDLIREDAREAGEASTRRVLGVVAGILQVERVSVWHLTPERDRLVCGLLYEWGADRYSSGLVLSAADFPVYFAALASDEVIAASDAVCDPRTREFRDGYLVPLGIGAMLDIPLRLNGRVDGVLCAEHVGGRREWVADEQVFALAAAGVLAVADEQAERRRAEEALRAGEERFRGAFDHAPIGMALVSLDGRWLRVNRAVCDILGYTQEELLATDFQTLTHPDDLGADLHLVQQTLTGEIASYQMEKRYFHKIGAVVHAVLAVSLARDANGQPLYFISHINDVTARKQAEAERQESEGRFRAVVEQAADAVFLTSADGTIVSANHQACDSLGYSAEELMGSTFRLFDPFLPADTHATLTAQLAAGRTACFETRHRRKDGSEFAVEVRLGRVELNGRPHRLSIARDITERKRAEDALRESEERFRAAMEGSLDAMFFLVTERDAAGTITDFRFTDLNSHGARLISRVREDVIGQRLCELLPVNRTDGFFDKYVRVVETGETLEEEFPIAADSIVAGWLHHQVVKVGDGVAITSQDVTARKRAELELRASENQLRTLGDNLPDGVVFQYVVGTDGRHRFPYMSRGIDRLAGVTAEAVMADADVLFSQTHPDDVSMLAAATRRSMEELSEFDLEIRRVVSDGEIHWFHARSAPRRLSDGSTVWDGVMIDVTERKRTEQELERANARLKELATTDGLTGVKNRAALDDKLAEEFDRAVRHGHSLSVVLLDVDFFKPFNDTFGHPAGDAILKQVARILADTVRGTDVVARYGGEEFVALLPDTDYAGAMVLAERLRRAVAGGAWEQRPITISVGVSTLTPTTPDAAALVQEADQAMYRSKQAGRNRVSHGSDVIPQMATSRPVAVG